MKCSDIHVRGSRKLLIIANDLSQLNVLLLSFNHATRIIISIVTNLRCIWLMKRIIFFVSPCFMDWFSACYHVFDWLENLNVTDFFFLFAFIIATCWLFNCSDKHVFLKVGGWWNSKYLLHALYIWVAFELIW
jgi:hypothetical protein